jgi:hypothetical protein
MSRRPLLFMADETSRVKAEATGLPMRMGFSTNAELIARRLSFGQTTRYSA